MNQYHSLKNNTELVSSKIIGRMGYNDDKPRSIRFPQSLWDAIDRDAKKSRRSSVKQMELVLSLYYDLAEKEVDIERLNDIKRAVSGSPTVDRLEEGVRMVKIPMEGEIGETAQKTRRKKAG